MAEAECALARIDPLQLAWAAGFFDGEGSTIVHQSKPGYLRLTVSVPQRGNTEPPEVLYRFREAMLRLGEIVPTPQTGDGMWAWRSRTGEEGQAVIALLWPYVGEVKRAQARTAISRFHAQYGPSGIAPRSPRRARAAHTQHSYDSVAAAPSEDAQFAWAAGFLDAEGHFGLARAASRKNAPDWHRIRASATQNGLPGHPPTVLRRLLSMFDGKIERHGEPDDFRWLIEGVTRVETVLSHVQPWLGTVKQEQARQAIQGFRSQLRLHGDRERCVRGHAYDRLYLSATGPKRRCRACARILGRMARARRGIVARAFTDVARRYNF